VENLVALVDVVKVSDEDLGWLYPDLAPSEVAHTWVDLGAAIVVVTLGGNGAIAVTAGRHVVTTPAVPVDVVDTVGAGDSPSWPA
jgi:fructokinase